MKLAAKLEASLREFVAAGAAEVCENGGRLAPMAKLSWEVRGDGDKPLLRLWSEGYNLTRRVIAITDCSKSRLALAVERFGRSRPDRLEFVRTDFERPAWEVAREEFCERLKGILAREFPDETLESASASADLEHSLSGNYVRGLLKRGSAHCAFLAVPGGETQDTVNNALTFGLLWLDRVRNTARRGMVGALRIMVPKDSCNVVAHRMACLDGSATVELYELDGTRERLEKIDPRRAGNVQTWLVPQREEEALLARARADIEPILSLDRQAITAQASCTSREVVLRYRGLAFARWDDGRIFFGVNDMRRELTAANPGEMPRIVEELHLHRHPLATDTQHKLYRAQAERWMEAMVRSDVTRVDAILDPRFVYTQVFAGAGSEHGIIDVLTVTRAGRLAILELKASENLHLPMQAADYWLRVRRHLGSGEFRSYGYFPGVEVQLSPPLVYLVAPSLRFHSATGTLLRGMTREMEVSQVGLAENWRRGIRVVSRQ